MDYITDMAEFHTAESLARLEADGFEPEFGVFLIPFDVYVRGLKPVSRVEEEPIWSAAQDCRHGLGSVGR